MLGFFRLVGVQTRRSDKNVAHLRNQRFSSNGKPQGSLKLVIEWSQQNDVLSMPLAVFWPAKMPFSLNAIPTSTQHRRCFGCG